MGDRQKGVLVMNQIDYDRDYEVCEDFAELLKEALNDMDIGSHINQLSFTHHLDIIVQLDDNDYEFMY